jgi:hypothetical protein
MDASWAGTGNEGGNEPDRRNVGDPYPPYGSLSKDEIEAFAALLRKTVLAHRFLVTPSP